MSTVAISLDGTDITAKVVIASAHFESAVNGIAGEARFRVRDETGTYSASVGAEVVLTIDGAVAWRGFLMSWVRTYVFPALNVTDFGPTRFFDAVCSDINVLLTKRFVFDQSSPASVLAPLLPAHTADTDALATLFADWLDLSGDGIDTTTLVENVGDTTWTQSGRAWEGSDSWAQAVQSIANLPAAIYYIDPDKNFVYTDVDTPDAAFGLSDQPDGTTTKGYSEMEILKDGTGLANDVMAWGVGYGSQVPVFVRDIDATSVSEHGVWQTGQTTFGVFKQTTIDRIAESIIDGSPQSKRGAKDDRIAVQCVTYEPRLRVAQKVDFTSNVFGFNDVIPIRKMAIDFDGPHTPKYSLTLSHEIDTPFGFFDPFMFNYRFPPFKVLPPFGFPLPGAVGCSDAVCGITDTFTRTVANGWGTSDAGAPWVTSASDPSVGVGVNGSVGYASLPIEEGLVADLFNLSGIGAATGFTATILCSVENVPDPTSDPSQGSMGVNLYTNLTLPSVNINVSKGAGVDTWDGTVRLQEDGGLIDVPYNDFGNAVPFYIKWQRIPSDTARVKVWNASDPEPSSWTAELPASAEVPTGFELDLESLTSAPAFDPNIISIDSLDIAGINRCTAIQFDDFERTVASGWADATPGGQTWTRGVSANGESFVTGGRGYLQNSAATTLETEEVVTGLNPAADFTATIYFWIADDNDAIDGSFTFASLAFGWHHDTGAPHPYLYIDDNLGGRVAVDFTDDFWSTLPGDAILLVERRAGIVNLTLWDEETTQPSPQIVNAPVGTGGYSTEGVSYSLLGTGVVGVTQMSVASIDFDYAGKPCYVVCGDSWVTFDDFERTVASGWGTPSSVGSPDWSDLSSSGVADVGIGIFGGVGAAHCTASNALFINYQDGGNLNLPWSRAFTMRTAWMYDAPLSSTDYVQPFWRVTDFDGDHSVGLILYITADVFDQSSLSVASTLFGVTTTASFNLVTNPPANDWIYLKWDFTPGGLMRAKIWWGSDPEPDWQVSDTSTVSTDGADKIFTVRNDQNITNIQYFQYFDFAGCTPILPGTGIPSNAWVCEQFAATTTLTLAHPFLLNSPQVWLNGGILPASAYTQDSAAGTITFGSAPGPGDTARVCYWALS